MVPVPSRRRLQAWALGVLAGLCAFTPSLAAEVLRGPYLQLGTDSAITVRWRTDTAVSSRVLYGPAPGNLNHSVDLGGSTADHVVPLTGLTPGSQYYYAVGTSTEVLAGADADHFFRNRTLSRHGRAHEDLGAGRLRHGRRQRARRA